MKPIIDVSFWQEKIDWAKVAPQVDGVILRGGYGQTVDSRFYEYVKGCRENRIPIKGVYWFCYAISSAEVRKEAECCQNAMEKAGLTKDVYAFFDLEYDSVKKAKAKGVTIGRAECDLFTVTFCDYFKQRGYNTGFYCNLDYYKNMYSEKTISNYTTWLADYYGDADKPCLYQQYTSKGKIDGINGNVDMNRYIGYSREDVTQKMDTIEKLISIANAEIGYLEKKNGNSLDSKTLNAGSNNYTKYWRDVKPSYQAQPWCACFVTWCMDRAFGQENTRKLLKHYPFVYVPTLAGMTSNKTPHKGDVVCFYRNGTFTHTGLVISVSGKTITTIEGNTSGGSTIIANGGGVCKKTYNTDNLSGTRFFRPDYSIVGGTTTGSATSGSSDSTDLKKGSKGTAVKVMQKMLIAIGYSCGSSGADGDFGTSTDKALRKFQSDHKDKLIADGIYGAGSRGVLLDLYDKKITVVAKDVIAGKYGNAEERKKDLESAGYVYVEVQAKVNQLLKK